METLSEKITFRQYEEGDLPAILHLWSEESGWGGITVEQFNTWFVNTPYGNSLIVVAENAEGKVIGQIVYAPTRMHVNGREIRSLRGAAPILSREMRGENIRDFNHPAFAMIRAGFEIAQEAGYQFVYSFPAFGWLGLFKSFPKTMPNPSEATSFECFLISLSNEKEWMKTGWRLQGFVAKLYSVRNMMRFGRKQWNSCPFIAPLFARQNGCSGLSAACMSWK
jgi:hypothetical protein